MVALSSAQDVASRGGEFVIHGVRVAGKNERGSFTMRFRWVHRIRGIVCLRLLFILTLQLGITATAPLSAVVLSGFVCVAGVAAVVSRSQRTRSVCCIAIQAHRTLASPTCCAEYVLKYTGCIRQHRKSGLPQLRRPAGKDVLDENTPLVGVPAVAKHNPAASQKFYFALVSREPAGLVSSASASLSYPGTPPLVRLRLGLSISRDRPTCSCEVVTMPVRSFLLHTVTQERAPCRDL